MWLEDNGHRFDLLLLQETHFGLGKEPSEYQLQGWTVISSPDPGHRWAGVAALVSHRIAAASSLQHCTVVPGRLLHVRFPVGQGRQARHVDVVCCYQWAWDADPAKQRLDKRHSFWRRLNSLVQGFPVGNVECIAGDFNCSLKAHPRHIGTGLHDSDFVYPDSADFAQTMLAANLCALNTWGPSKAAYTYCLDGQHPKRSQIDYIFASLPQSDAHARRAHTDRAINFAPWRGGGRHFAVVASLRLDTRLAPPPARVTPACTFSRTLLLDAIRRKDPVLEQLALDVDHDLGRARPTSPDDVNAALLRHCERLFPCQPGPHKAEHSIVEAGHTQAKHTVKHMWAAYQAYKDARAGDPSLTGLQNTSATLRAHAKFKEIQKILRKQGLANRKAKVLAELEAAEIAAQAGDMHKLYYHIRRLSPKGPRESIHIRSPDGKLISPEAEHRAILQYYTGVFSRDAACPRPTCALQHAHDLSLTELLTAMSKQRSGRAFPPGSAPPELWKCLAPTLAPHVLPLINSYLEPGPIIFPSIWTDCWLKPLPKPTKPPNSAANLRPIAL